MTVSVDHKLDGRELETWNSYLMATRLLLEKLDHTLSDEVGLSLPDFIVLFKLSQNGDEGTRMSELADAGVFSRSRISHAFRRLEDEGWVERRACPTDRRGSFGYLTDPGREKLAHAESIHTDAIRRYFLDPVGDSHVVVRSVSDSMTIALGGQPNDSAC